MLDDPFLIFLLVGIPTAFGLIAVFWIMDRHYKRRHVLSSKSESVSLPPHSFVVEKAPEQAQNQKLENKTEASENQKQEAELSENRKLAIVKAVKRCLDAGIDEAQIASLLQSYRTKAETQEEAARACMVKQVPSSVVAVLVGGDKQTTLRWIASVAEKPAVKEEA